MYLPSDGILQAIGQVSGLPCSPPNLTSSTEK